MVDWYSICIINGPLKHRLNKHGDIFMATSLKQYRRSIWSTKQTQLFRRLIICVISLSLFLSLSIYIYIYLYHTRITNATIMVYQKCIPFIPPSQPNDIWNTTKTKKHIIKINKQKNWARKKQSHHLSIFHAFTPNKTNSLRRPYHDILPIFPLYHKQNLMLINSV